MKDTRKQALFRRSSHNKLSVFVISQPYCEMPKRTIRANSNMYHMFKPNKFRDLQKP